MRWSGVALTLLAPVAALAALGPRYGGILEVGVLDLRPELASGHARGAGTRALRGLVHESLVRIGAQGELVPSLAATWRPMEDGASWSVDLASGASFHDGSAVTAADVVRSLRLFLRSGAPAALLLAEQIVGGRAFASGETEQLAGLEASGASSFVVRLVHRTPILPPELGSAVITAADGAGAGAYRMLHFVPGERLRLIPFGAHVRGRPLPDAIDLRPFADAAALSRAFDAGSVALALGIPGNHDSVLLLLRVESRSGPFSSFGERLRLEAALDRKTLAERFVPGGRAACGLLAGEQATDCPASSLAPTSLTRRPLRLALDPGVPPATSRRLVAHLLGLGYDPAVEVAPPDRPAPQADLRVLLFAPESPDALCGLVEAAGLVGRSAEMAARLAPLRAQRAQARAGLLDAERELLAGRDLLPLATMPAAAWKPTVRGVSFGVDLEDAWMVP